MKKTLVTVFILVLAVLHGPPAHAISTAYDVLICHTKHIYNYDPDFEAGLASVVYQDAEILDITDEEPEALRLRITRHRPRVVVGIGMTAQEKIRAAGVIEVPKVFTLVVGDRGRIHNEFNETGIFYEVPFEKQLAVYAATLPRIRRIDVPYSPEFNAETAARFRRAAEAYNATAPKRDRIDVVFHPVAREQDSGNVLADLLLPRLSMPRMSYGRPRRAVYMLPDKIVWYNWDMYHSAMAWSLENLIPILVPNYNLLTGGAAATISMRWWDLGEQTGCIVREVLKGRPAREIDPQTPLNPFVFVNPKVIDHYRIRVDRKKSYAVRESELLVPVKQCLKF